MKRGQGAIFGFRKRCQLKALSHASNLDGLGIIMVPSWGGDECAMIDSWFATQ